MSVRNDIVIDWNSSPRIITVEKNGAESQAISLQDLVDTLRSIEYQADTMAYGYLIDSFGKQALGGGVLVGITLVLKNAKLAFEARPPSTFVQCNISGGNLVAVDEYGDDMDAVETTAYTQVIKTSSSSATLQELLDIQFGSFTGGVTIDTVNGVAGTVYPTGTPRQPVNNLANAKTIAASRGFGKLFIVGDFTFEAADNIDGFIVHGESPHATTVTVTSGCSTVDTEFEELKLTGALSGNVELHHSVLNTITGFQGTAHGCTLTGDITLAGTSSDKVDLLQCWAGIPGSLPEIDMGGDGPSLGVRGYSGGMLFKNKTGASTVSVDFISGRLSLASTVTAGTVKARGMYWISQNDATGITLETEGSSYQMPADVEGAVWSAAEALIIRKMTENKITRVGDIITIFEDNGTTVWKKFDLSKGGRVEV